MNTHPSRNTPRRAAALFAALLFVDGVVCGQVSESGNESKKDEAVRLDPYTVTDKSVVGWNSQMTFSGSRTSQNLLEVPMNISILTNQYLQDTGAVNLLDVLRYGASGATPRVGYREEITIRGYLQKTLIDGIDFLAEGFYPLYDVERVEIIKGPTALVFSNFGNVSGTVNYVTKRPTSKPSGDVSLTVGNFGTYIGSITQSGPVTRDASVRYRLTAGAQEKEGWMGRGTDANEYSDNRFFSGSVDWTLTPKLELRFNVCDRYETTRSFEYAYIDPTTNQVWTRSADGYSVSSDWEKRSIENQHGRLEAVFNATEALSFRAIYQINSAYYHYTSSWSNLSSALLASEAPGFRVVGTRVNPIYDSPRDSQNTIVDGTWKFDAPRFSNRLNTGWQYVVSQRTGELYFEVPIADLVIDAPVSSRAPAAPFTSWSAYMPARRSPSRNNGWTAYIHDSASLLDGRLILAAGGRYISDSATTLPGKTELVPNYGIVYRIVPSVSVYASRAESYTPRFGRDVFGTALVNTVGRSQEIGVKFNALGERFFGTASYFDILVDPVFRNVQGINPVTGLTMFGNAQLGKEVNKGYEMDLGYSQQIGRANWSIFATAYSADPKNANGTTPSSAVRKKYTLFTKMDLTTGDLKGLSFGGGFSHIGDAPGTGFPLHPGYDMVTVMLRYRWGSWNGTVNVDNLADKRGAILGSEGRSFVYLAAPRSYKLTVSRTW